MAAIMKPLLYTFFASVACGVQVAAQTAAGATLSTPRITNSTSVTPTVVCSSRHQPSSNSETECAHRQARLRRHPLPMFTLTYRRSQSAESNLMSTTSVVSSPHLQLPDTQAVLTVLATLADINLNANVAKLVTINAGVQVGITKVNLTIADVDAQLELIVRLGKLRPMTTAQ